MLCEARNDRGSGWIISPTRLYPDLDTSGYEYENRWRKAIHAILRLEGLENGRPLVFRLHDNKFCWDYSVKLPSELM